MAISASSRMRECGTRSTEGATRGIVSILPLLLLLQVPQLPRQHPPAERAIVHAHKLVPIIAEDQEILGVDLGDDGPVAELVRLRMARQVAVHQLLELGTTSHSPTTLLRRSINPVSRQRPPRWPMRSRRPIWRNPMRSCSPMLARFSAKIPACSVHVPCDSESSTSAASNRRPSPCPRYTSAT